MPEAGLAPLSAAPGAGVTAWRRAGRGLGPTVVLIHGVGMRADVWAPQIAALAAGYDVVAYDMLGHGGSSLPPEEPRLADYADQLLALLDHLGIAAAHVVGHSMGALVALEFALLHPKRTRSVVAVNAVYRRSAEQRAAVEARAASLEGVGAAEGGSASAATLARWFGEPIPAALVPVAAEVETCLATVDPVGYARTYRLFATSDDAHVGRLSTLAVPALFLTGSDDGNSTPAMSETMAAEAPRGRAEIIPGARHMMALVEVEAVNRAVIAFLEEVAAMPPAFDRTAFRRALGTFLTGVTVVATRQDDGEPRGFTANSFTSVSLDPPLVLVCIAKTAASFDTFTAAPSFSVNVLAESQKDVSGLFASKAPDKFARAHWHTELTGSPIIDGSAAWFDCRRHDVIEAGDHVILIGEVVGFDQARRNPLGYCLGNYVTFGLSLDAIAGAGKPHARVGAILEHEGAVLLSRAAGGGIGLPTAPALGPATDPASLTGRLAREVPGAKLGFIFSVFEDDGATSIYYRGTLAEAPEETDGLELVPFADIPWDRIGDGAVRSMLARFVRERGEDQFGIYVGDAVAGTVQSLSASAPSFMGVRPS